MGGGSRVSVRVSGTTMKTQTQISLLPEDNLSKPIHQLACLGEMGNYFGELHTHTVPEDVRHQCYMLHNYTPIIMVKNILTHSFIAAATAADQQSCGKISCFLQGALDKQYLQDHCRSSNAPQSHPNPLNIKKTVK